MIINLWLVELQLLYHHFVMAFGLPLFVIDILINLIADLVHSLVQGLELVFLVLVDLLNFLENLIEKLVEVNSMVHAHVDGWARRLLL